jgi:hypothetical protein
MVIAAAATAQYRAVLGKQNPIPVFNILQHF